MNAERVSCWSVNRCIAQPYQYYSLVNCMTVEINVIEEMLMPSVQQRARSASGGILHALPKQMFREPRSLYVFFVFFFFFGMLVVALEALLVYVNVLGQRVCWCRLGSCFITNWSWIRDERFN